jgi:hypothetical protein
MKAEQRHRLETNSLADRMGRVVETVRSAPATQSLALWLGIIVVLIVIIAWQFFRSAGHAETSALWRTLDAGTRDTGDFPQSLQSLVDDHPGTTVATSAGFQLARVKLQEGQVNLGNSLEMDRKDAIKKLLDARNKYANLAKESADIPLLMQESLLMQAKIDESLIGVPDPEKPTETLSTLAKAKSAYEAVATKYPDSAAGLAAKKRLEDLEKNQAQIEAFYTKYNELLTSTRPSMPVFPPSMQEKPTLPTLPSNLSTPENPPANKPADGKAGETKPAQPADAKAPATPAKPADGKAPATPSVTPEKKADAAGAGSSKAATSAPTKQGDTKTPPAPEKK